MVSFLDPEERRNVSRNTGVPLLIPMILFHKMKAVSADNNSPIHLCTVACSSNNSASDKNSSSECALPVNVCPAPTRVLEQPEIKEDDARVLHAARAAINFSCRPA